MNYAICCDWCQWSAVVPASFDPAKVEGFTLVETSEHHPMFESSALVRDGSTPLAILFWRAKKGNGAAGCVKVENSRLYYPSWHAAVINMLHAIDWHITSTTRIDVAIDVDEFIDRSCAGFIESYLSRPRASRPSFVRHSSNKFRVYGVRRLFGARFDTLAWGTRDSACQVNLYNKSLELAEKTDKPWIRQFWIENGLGNAPAVWRIEFSLRPSQLMMTSNVSELKMMQAADVATPAALSNLAPILAQQYFTFHRIEAGMSAKRVRDLPIHQLLPFSFTPSKLCGVRYVRKTARAEELMFARLIKFLKEEPDLTPSEAESVHRCVMAIGSRLTGKRAEAVKSREAETLAADFLAHCFRAFNVCDESGMPMSASEQRRLSQKWLLMLTTRSTEEWSDFAQAFAKCEELAGTELFESLYNAANYVAASAMPDEAIAQWVDEDIEREALLANL